MGRYLWNLKWEQSVKTAAPAGNTKPVPIRYELIVGEQGIVVRLVEYTTWPRKAMRWSRESMRERLQNI